MRDYVRAVRAVWTAWQQRTPLAFESPHYNLSLMVPLFDPGPIEHPDIPIHVAAVNPTMCRFVGEVADGLRPHPVCTPRYIRDVMLPAMRAGAAAAGRSPALAVAMKPLVCAAPDEVTLAARVAFYASTPGYRAAFEVHGLGDLAAELAVLSRAQRWEEMPSRITDEVLHTYALVGTYAQIGRKLVERYRGLVTDVEFSIPATTPGEQGILRELVQEIRREAA
jgi:probable F420-dependent oxidoreductase